MNVHTSIDRRKCVRTTPMKILVLGLSRTGTESLKNALQILGYADVYHGYTAAFENPRDCELWMEALRAKFDGVGNRFGRREWDGLLGHCQAVTDMPAAAFAEDLIQAYPEAKIILTTRDIDDWHESVKSALLANMYSRLARLTQCLAVLFNSSNKGTRPMFTKAFDSYFTSDFEANGKARFREHNALVRSLAQGSSSSPSSSYPSTSSLEKQPGKLEGGDKLLEFNVKEGWAPLCAFLEKEIPCCTFPRGNCKVETTMRIRALVWFEFRKAAWVICRLVVCGLIGWILAVKIREAWEV